MHLTVSLLFLFCLPPSSAPHQDAVENSGQAADAQAATDQAQDSEDDEPVVSEVPEGHSLHGEAFNEGPRQAAYLMPNPGSVHFPITTDDADVQAMFDQGVGQLHGFWYFEAERSFRQVAALQPDCASAYWGMAMANFDNEDRAEGFAQDAWERREQASERERMFIDGIARYFGVQGVDPGASASSGSYSADSGSGSDTEEESAESKSNKERRARLVKDFEQILFEYPDDIEAKALLVNLLWMNGYEGLPISSKQANQALLDQIFAVQPDHPAHHYRIHLWDAEDTAKYAVNSATKSGPAWPTVAHMWHMGGHIFARLGRHNDAAWQQEASARIDHAHMMRDRVLPDQIHNFAHNNEWLVRSLSHAGRAREGIELARNMIELPRHPEYNGLEKRGSSAWWGRRRLFGTLESFELWDELIELSQTNYLDLNEEADDEAYRSYLLGKAHTFLGNDDERDEHLNRLGDLIAIEKVARIDSLEEAEEDAIAENKKPADVRDAMAIALEDHEDELMDLRDKLAALEALQDVLDSRDLDAAFAKLEEHNFGAVVRARLMAETGRAAEAERLARETVENREGDAPALATLVYVLETNGEHEKALESFEQLRELSARFDLDLPLFERISYLGEELGYGTDWRAPYVQPDDVGNRVDLDTLGPKWWSPPIAPDWIALDAESQEHHMVDSSGRPRILILFLGFGCVHCVEQLEAFAPAAEQFQDAGIDLIAIGDDPAEKIAEYEEQVAFPFPVLSDATYDVFRAYRSYDDFEQMPLHGTFLLDEQDRVRWQDVSFEPFTDTEFLLAEAKRLLGLPDAPMTASSVTPATGSLLPASTSGTDAGSTEGSGGF